MELLRVFPFLALLLCNGGMVVDDGGAVVEDLLCVGCCFLLCPSWLMLMVIYKGLVWESLEGKWVGKMRRGC